MNALTSYLPSCLVSSVRDEALAPSEQRRLGVLLFADISGFTPLTERLAQRGPDGAEALSRILNDYFGAVIDLIHSFGGDIIRFAGDAPFVVWFVDTHEQLPEAVSRASQCALTLQAKLDNYEALEQTRLSLRMGVGVGEFSLYCVGGLSNRWEFVVAGDPLAQVVAAEQTSKPGEVILSPEAHQMIASRANGEAVGSFFKLRGVIETPSTDNTNNSQEPQESERQQGAAAPVMNETVRRFIPRPALARLDSGLAGSSAELRRVSILFLQFSRLLSPPYDRLDALQEAFSTIQEEVYRYGGSINQFLVDDKGTTLLAVWGLPTCTHEDNAARALQAAMALQQWFSSRQIPSSIGVSSGRVFCGDRGSALRREYAVIGKGVNLAARLMQAAMPDKVLCDENTRQEARNIVCIEQAPVSLKGWSSPVKVFVPVHVKGREAKMSAQMIGRHKELQVMQRFVEKLSQGEEGLLCIEGEAGIGKTQLVSAFLHLSQEKNIACLLGAGSSIESATPYYAWRSVVGQLLLRDGGEEQPERYRERLYQLFAGDEASLSRLPLLQSIIPIDVDETPQTLQMDKQVRSDNLHRLVHSLVQKATSDGPLVVVLDDLHWLDTASLELARMIARDSNRVGLLLATRPVLEAPLMSYQQLLSMPTCQRLLVEALPREDVGQLVVRRLGAESLSAEVESFLYEKAKGHPFFSEELAYALRDLGAVVIREGELRLAPNIELSKLQFPETLNGVIASRIDRLSSSQQLLLKAASVIGRVFSQKTLLEIRALNTEDVAIVQELEVLRRLDLTLLETPEPKISYLFKHILTQEVAYNLLLFSQRRALHRAVAVWYEKSFAEDLSPYFALLAYHWQKAEEAEKALFYTEKAGEQALRGFANEEAVRFFQEALRVAEKLPVDVSRRERWERQLGEAFYGMGRLAESREHLLRALALLGSPVPEKTGTFALALGRQITQQTVHRLYTSPPEQQHREELLEVARVHELLALNDYFSDNTFGAVYATLQTVNLAERAGPSPELARAYAASCMAAGLVPLHSLALIYERRAKETARAENKQTRAWILQATGAYHAGRGDWREAMEDLSAAHALYEEMGDWRSCDQEKAIMAWSYHAQGDLTTSDRLYSETYQSAKKRDDPQAKNWGLCGQSENALHRDHESIERVVSYMEEAKSLLRYNLGRPEAVRVFGLLALAYYRCGQATRAKETALEGLQRVSLLAPPTSFYSLEGYSGLAETMLSLWRDGDQGARSAALSACRGMAAYARVFPAGGPRAELLWGIYEEQLKHPKRAARHWKNGLLLAKKMRRPYEEKKMTDLLR
jgi:class 3 adenylate cyclase